MRSRTLQVVVVGLLLGLAALARWGEAGGAPTQLTAPDTTPPERVPWKGLAVPLEEGQRQAAIEATKQLEAEQKEMQRGETKRREPKGSAAGPREAQRREVLQFLAGGLARRATRRPPSVHPWRPRLDKYVPLPLKCSRS